MEMKEEFLDESIPVKCQTINEVVEQNVNKNTVYGITEKLNYYIEQGSEIEKYVFKGPQMGGRKFSLCVLVLFLIVYIILLIISLCVLVFSKEFRLYGLCGLLGTLFVTVLNFILISKSSHTVRFINRYNQYFSYLEYRNSALVDDISCIFKVKKEIVIKDLKEALEYRFIPQGQLVNDDKLLLVSAKMITRYQRNKDKNDEKINNIAFSSNDSEDPYLKKIYLVIDENIKLINKVMKGHSSKEIDPELKKTESLLIGLKYSGDLAPDDAASMESFVENYTSAIEKLVSSYMQLVSNDKKKAKIKATVYKKAIQYVNKAYIVILNEYYSKYSILEE